MVEDNTKNKNEIAMLELSITQNKADLFPLSTAQINPLSPFIFSTNNSPGGEARLIQKPVRLHYALTSGVVTVVDGNCISTLPGKLLRGFQVAV